MPTTIQAVKEAMAKKERGAKRVRITDKTYNELAKLGDVTDDFEDVIARLLKYYKERESKQRT
jgi:predicted CopG family antitoxin